MNIFVLDRDPIRAAQMQCDKHVVKMCLETAQILSTINGGPYKPTHAKHPCVLWAGENRANYLWLWGHGMALGDEYRHRYGKFHKCHSVILSLNIPPERLRGTEIGKRSAFVQCMPEVYRGEDAVEAYRRYYRAEKAGFAKWTRRDRPDWWE